MKKCLYCVLNKMANANETFVSSKNVNNFKELLRKAQKY